MTLPQERVRMLQQLKTREMVGQLEALTGVLAGREFEIGSLKAQEAQIQESLKLRREQLVLDGLSGKNEREREAALAVTLASDGEAKALREALSTVQAKLLTEEVQRSSASRQWRALALQLELRTAQIHFLAGGENEHG